MMEAVADEAVAEPATFMAPSSAGNQAWPDPAPARGLMRPSATLAHSTNR